MTTIKYYEAIYDFEVLETIIKRRNASKLKADQRAEDLIKIYNRIINLNKLMFKTANDTEKHEIRQNFIGLRDRLITNLTILKRNDIYIPTDFTQEVKYFKRIEDSIELTERDKQKNTKMTTTKIEYYNLCSRTLTATYEGDPLGLTPFIRSIELLESLDGDKTHQTVLRDFVLTKLKGVASECQTENPTIKQIIDTLKLKIKPENSKIISGKMMAIKADRTNLTDYTRQTEMLAEQFKRSLILEGIPTEQANKITIEKTIDLCKANTNSTVVKSVLLAKKFDDAKEVIAEFVIGSRSENGDQQILSYRANRNYTNTNYRGRRNFYRGNYGNNGYNNNNFNNARFNSRNDQNRRMMSSQYRENQNTNWRMRGNNQRNNGYQNNRMMNNYRGRNNNRNTNRVYYAENEEASPSGASQGNSRVQIIQTE